jgi:hypothetical protein
VSARLAAICAKPLVSLLVALAAVVEAQAVCPDITFPGTLNGSAATDTGADNQPRVVTDGQGRWLAVWASTEDLGGAGTDEDLLVSRSLDNGTSWIAATLLNSNGASDFIFTQDRAPQIATDAVGTWVVVWQSNDDMGGAIGADEDIFVARSTTNGATWSSATFLNTNAGSDNGADVEPQVITDGAGTWLAVWSSSDTLGGTLGTDSDLLFSRSVDGGITWTPPAALNTNAATDTGADTSPSVVTDGSGVWITVWSSTDALGGIGTDRDVLYARSFDGGASWSVPAALNTNAATDSGADTLPQISTDGGGNWLAAWVSSDPLTFPDLGSDLDILYARSVTNGASWTSPKALNPNAPTDSGGDTTPHVATDSNGLWFAVWSSVEDLGGATGFDSDIFYSYSTDNGLNWAATALFNANGATDNVAFGSDLDLVPQIATDGLTHWVATWGSGDDLDGAVGSDADIFVARFEMNSDDCDMNGVFDGCELAGGSQDCNGNLILDECEPNDCNGNGRPDECDLPVPGADCNGNEILDVCEGLPDCNNNQVLDECDLSSGESDDCNGNTIPDECDIASCPPGDDSCADCTGNEVPDGCEPDCDGNGTADSCDIAACPGGTPSCQDCDGNAVLDGCDITGGTHADSNGNGIPDLCEVCTVSAALTADTIKRCIAGTANGASCASDANCPGGGSCLPPRRNRFLSFEIPPAAAGHSWAIRVKIVKLYDETICPPRPDTLPDLSLFDGDVRWVAVPQSLPESQEPDANRWIGAALTCCPQFRDWPAAMTSAGGGIVLDVYGAEVLACSRYELQFVDTCCPDLTVEACYSPKLELRSGKFGDVAAPFYYPGLPQPDFRDVGAEVNKYKSFYPPLKVDTLLRDEIPPVTQKISFIDIGLAVEGYKSIHAKNLGPTNCAPCP